MATRQQPRSLEEFDRDSEAEVQEKFVTLGEFGVERFWKEVNQDEDDARQPNDGTEEPEVGDK